MLAPTLIRFNKALEEFQGKFPVAKWSKEFKSDLINDFTFYSSKIEDKKIQYGATIQFLNDQLLRKETMKSLLDLANHKVVLQSLIAQYENFKLNESTIKSIHKNLMSNESSWETEFKPHLVGEYRTIPTIGIREPLFTNKEYVDHFKLDIVMASYIELFNRKFDAIDNTNNNTHILSALSYFHNIFLNTIHPFADGNGRVCRIIMGTILMKNNCPPIFVKIISEQDRFEYINSIVECEKAYSDEPFIQFLANGMAEYMEDKIREAN